MKKTLKLLIAATILTLAVTFVSGVFADDTVQPSVNAVESADEDAVKNNADTSAKPGNDLITESEALAGQNNDNNQPESISNPATGVAFAIVPAIIALVILIVLFVIKKIKK